MATTCSCSSRVTVRNSRETEQVSASSKVRIVYDIFITFCVLAIRVKIKNSVTSMARIIIRGDMIPPTISSTGVNVHLKSRVDSCKARFNARTINTLRAIGGNLTAGDKYLYNSGRVRCTYVTTRIGKIVSNRS